MIYDLLNEFAGLTREEADDYFVIETEEKGWRLKARRYLEVGTFKAVLTLAKEYGGTYYNEKGLARFFIPKLKITEAPQRDVGVTPELLNVENEKPYNLKESIKALGPLAPILKDAHGNIIDGFHRMKEAGEVKWPVVELNYIDNNVKLELARLAVNFCRRQVPKEELEEKIGFLIGAGLKPKDIAERTGISLRTVYRYMPSHLKDKIMAELGSKGAEKSAKVKEGLYKRKLPAGNESEILRKEATTQLETPQFQNIQENVLQELVECNICHMGVHKSKAHLINGKYVCPRCFERLPTAYRKTAKPKSETKIFKPKETWTQRKAVMQPQHSKIEEALLEKFSVKGLNVETDRDFCLQQTTPDFYFPERRTAIYIDGPVHAKREDRDELLRELLAKRYDVKVVSIAYKAFTKEETERVFHEIMEALR